MRDRLLGSPSSPVLSKSIVIKPPISFQPGQLTLLIVTPRIGDNDCWTYHAILDTMLWQHLMMMMFFNIQKAGQNG